MAAYSHFTLGSKRSKKSLYANQVQNPSFSAQRTDKLPEKDTPSIAGKNSGFHSELSVACEMGVLTKKPDWNDNCNLEKFT